MSNESPFPTLVCMHCMTSEDQVNGHFEYVQTGDTAGKNGWEIWYCCHICRDNGEPCETFFPVPLDWSGFDHNECN